MQAAFALLADHKVTNLVRKIAWQADQRFQTGMKAAWLEPHVSLKQSFEIQDFAGLEEYMQILAASLPPVVIHITGLQAVPATIDGQESGILWFEVEQTNELRTLHTRLNRELEARFGPTPAEHDGPSYHFHMTVALGGQPFEVFKAAAQALGTPPIELYFTATVLALFVQYQPAGRTSRYFTYKRLPLGQEFEDHPWDP
jgi:2'-5' RNA ligase